MELRVKGYNGTLFTQRLHHTTHLYKTVCDLADSGCESAHVTFTEDDLLGCQPSGTPLDVRTITDDFLEDGHYQLPAPVDLEIWSDERGHVVYLRDHRGHEEWFPDSKVEQAIHSGPLLGRIYL